MATITQRGNSYRIRVSVGYDKDCKQIIRSMTWKPDAGMTKRQIEKELNRQATLFEEQEIFKKRTAEQMKTAALLLAQNNLFNFIKL